MSMKINSGKPVLLAFMILALVVQGLPAQAELAPALNEAVQSAPVNPAGPLLIGSGLASTLAGGVFLLQSLPLKAEADRLIAASDPGSTAASANFYGRFGLGLGCTLGGLALTSLGFWLSNSDMDYTRVPPPAPEVPSGTTLSLVLEGTFVGMRLSN